MNLNVAAPTIESRMIQFKANSVVSQTSLRLKKMKNNIIIYQGTLKIELPN
jgi:hypothetical protein